MQKIKNGISYDLNGWKYISVKGSPRERGYAHGYFIAKEFREVQNTLKFIMYNDYGREWDFFIEGCKTDLKPVIMEQFPEFYEEIEGIADGCNAGGTVTTVDEMLAWNNYFTLTENWYPTTLAKAGTVIAGHGEGGAKERCSAFIACGDYTADGKIVCAHNNFSNFVDGQFANVVLDITPDKGNRMLIQMFPGWIWSGTDFFVTSKGIIGTETTIGGFIGYEANIPVSCRIRQAMQYGNNLDDYVEILLNGNSGDYANSWLFGDINTNEILRLELGLKYHNIERTKNGYFVGFNAAYDPRIRNLECVNSGFDDIRRHQGARAVRLPDLMDKHKGKINIDIAKQIIGDHHDVYLNKFQPCSRTVCSHYELDAREFMSQADRPKPYQPRGALDGCVVDSTMAKNMAFELRYGNSCGLPFDKNEFCNLHRQWDYLRPYLRSRPQQPWTVFSSHVYKKKSMNKTRSLKTTKKQSRRRKH